MTALNRHCRRAITGTNVLLHTYGQWLFPRNIRLAAPRLAGSAATGLFVGSMALNTPSILWPLTGWWAVAGWRAGRRAERQAAADGAFVHLVRRLIGDGISVHLATILTALGDAVSFEDLRSTLDRLGIPVRDSVKIDNSVSPGVHLDDLTDAWDVQLTPPPALKQPLPEPVTRDNYPTTPTVTASAGGAQITVTPACESTRAA